MRPRLALLLALWVVPVASASVLSSGTETEPAWVILTVDARSPVTASVVTNFTGQGAHGIVIHRVGDQPWQDLEMFGIWHGASYEATASPTGVVLRAPTEPFSFGLGLTRTYASATYRILLWSVGHFSTFEWSLAAEDASVISVERGTDVLFLDGAEASEGMHAHASVSGYGASVSDATYEVDVDKEFIGVIGRQQRSYVSVVPLEPRSSITHTSPEGETETCPCSASGGRTWTPGAHVLRWQGLDAYGSWGQPLLLAGVDAPLHVPG